jgi:transcriptional regulator
MYLRAAHAETSLPTLLSLIRSYPLGLLTTAIPSPSGSYPLLQHTLLPWVLDPPTNLDELVASGQADAPPTGNVKTPVQGLVGCKLRGHMARGNPHARALVEGEGTKGNGWLANEVTVYFRGREESYITPQWYTTTKPETGKVVPTWDYVAVEVRGRMRVVHEKGEEETGQWLQRQVEELTGESEGRIMGEGEGKGWKVGDAPAGYIEVMKKGILGVEVVVESVVGKWKMSQELKGGDREGVVRGLRGLGVGEGDWVARAVEERGKGL